jgi:hypothetical protein
VAAEGKLLGSFSRRLGVSRDRALAQDRVTYGTCGSYWARVWGGRCRRGVPLSLTVVLGWRFPTE